MEKIDIASFFPPAGAKHWKQQIQYDLKGADYNDSLVWDSPEGIKVRPFYTSADLEGNEIRTSGRGGDLLIGQAIHASESRKTNPLSLKAIENGAGALEFHIPTNGISPEELFRGIDLQRIEVHCHFGFLSEEYLCRFLEALPEDPKGVFLHLDIIGHLARTGNWYQSYNEDTEVIRKLLKNTANKKGISLLGVDGRRYLNAGANCVQQLAYMLAHGCEYLHLFGKAWTPPVSLSLSVGSDYFFEIAKTRALRLLWDTLATAFDISPECHLLASPGLRNKTIYDYNCNMFRTTSECMAAILGGADTVVNLPYDALFHKPNDFGERIALNQLLILKNEAHFWDVSNPADGAYYLESLTLQLAEKSLALFKQIEAGGGFLRQLKDHKIQGKIRESAAREQRQFDLGELVLVGTNAFQDKGERMKEQVEINLHGVKDRRQTIVEPILEKRLAEKVELKRLADE